MRLLFALVVAAIVLVAPASAAVQATAAPTYGPTVSAAMPPLYKNCTAFNKKYPHGVGKLEARDKTKFR